MILFQETRPAGLREASRLRNELSRRFVDLRLPDHATESLLLGLSEILANILKHSTPAAGFIGVRVDLLGAQLRLEVTDDAGSFFDFVERAASAADIVRGELCESGRGLGLIAASLDRISYQAGTVNRSIGWKSLASDKPLALIVEDDETLLDIYAHFLRDLRVVKARNCEEALVVIRELEVSVIVADLHLGDGLATRLVQAVEEEWEQSAPIVLVSGTHDVEGPQDALERGIELFLAKPVTGSQLRAAVDLAITRSARRAARIARSFARKVDGLLSAQIPSFICGHDVVMVRSNASVGGGDLVFEHALSGRRRIVLLDVMGHGITAKSWAVAYAALCRGLSHAQPLDDCGTFLKRLAEIAWRDRAMDAVIATALALDMFEDGRIDIASAGHPPPVIISAGAAIPVLVGGGLLGIRAPDHYERASVRLVRGERLVLVTDGVDSGDVAAGGMLPSWLIEASRETDLFRVQGRELVRVATDKLGVQPKDDWTVIVIGPGESGDHA